MKLLVMICFLITRSTANRDMSKKLILYRGERSAMRLAFLHVGMKLEGKIQ